LEKSENLRFYGQNKKINLSTLPFSPWAILAAWLHVGAPQKMILKPVMNKTSPRAHTESEFDVLGVPRKLVKYAIYSSKIKNWKKIKFLHTSCPNSNQPSFGLKEF
jgi:hypothetical protein